jgi:hypothetical protein
MIPVSVLVLACLFSFLVGMILMSILAMVQR